jgi:hypothetical protein
MRKFVLIFMSNILIFIKTLEEHIQHHKLVFETLLDNHLFIKFNKYTFAHQQIVYLGHIISQHGVTTDPSKTDVMLKWYVPQNSTELRGFLGLAGYYRKFGQHYGTLARPLTNMLHHKKFIWTDFAQQAFEYLKQAMTSTPVLAFPNISKEFTIKIDACDTSIGAVLTQEGHPLAYFNKGLSASNKKL